MRFTYQRVIRRKLKAFQPQPKDLKHILCYVEEELECGHKVDVYPTGEETFTARKRNCHKCCEWFGALKLPGGRKLNASIVRSYERIKRNTERRSKERTIARA